MRQCKEWEEKEHDEFLMQEGSALFQWVWRGTAQDTSHERVKYVFFYELREFWWQCKSSGYGQFTELELEDEDDSIEIEDDKAGPVTSVQEKFEYDTEEIE